MSHSVSLSADGNTLAIGAKYNDGDNGASSGHVRIYKNVNNNWVQVGSDIDGEAAGDRSGTAVSLSADGSIVAISAPYNVGNGNNGGHVRIFQTVNNNDFLTANFNFDNETKFSDLGIMIDSSFSVSSSHQLGFTGKYSKVWFCRS